MRYFALLFSVFILCVLPLMGQAEGDDPYALKFVQANLRITSGATGVDMPGVAKNFQRLGDAVSIALLKILDQQELTNPTTVESFLPLIRDSFSFPSIISVEANKKPKVTLFFLRYLEQNVSDKHALSDIRQTMNYVKEKTGT